MQGRAVKSNSTDTGKKKTVRMGGESLRAREARQASVLRVTLTG